MEYLIIDPSTRKITIPKSEQLFGVYGEGNIERKYFKCPKIVGDVIKACITSGIQMQECIVNTVSKWTTAIETAITSYSIVAQNGNFASGTVYIIGR